jgi:6,7-dimethyl-8-ribityllumazine synthase
VPDRYAIVAATFYEELAQKLIEGARRVFEDAGHELDVFEVPGCFELPMAAKKCALSGKYRGVACVGAVIRGETTHYDYVCNECARGIQNVQLETGIPLGFGVLTVENYDQALARVGEKRHQGEDAARAVLALTALEP